MSELELLRAERDALAQIVSNLGGDPDEICCGVRKALAAGLTVAPPRSAQEGIAVRQAQIAWIEKYGS